MKRLLNKPLRMTVVKRRILKALIHLSILGYLAALFYAGLKDNLGGDPVKVLLHNSGLTAVIMLLLTLLVSPAAKHLPCGDLMKFRRLLGVYAFFAAVFHLVVYVAFEIQLDMSLLVGEIIERPYITVGFVGFLILFALTVTSPNTMKKRMGRKWQTLHNGVYASLFLALLHFSWSEKTLLQDSIYYWVLGLLLMAFRINWVNRRSQALKS